MTKRKIKELRRWFVDKTARGFSVRQIQYFARNVKGSDLVEVLRDWLNDPKNK